MANANKGKGTSWETEVVRYLDECGLLAKRTGSADMDSGDIHMGEWTIEAKHEQRIDLPGYLKQLAKETTRADRPHHFASVWVKNRRHSTGDAYAVMSGENYRSLMLYVTALEVLLEDTVRAVMEAASLD